VLGERGKGWQEWTELPFADKDYVAEIQQTGRLLRRRFGNFVLFGIGGSALGPLAVANALLHLRHNEVRPGKRKGPRFYVEDNVDPERMAALFDIIDPADTLFNIVTKSGETGETLSQMLLVLDILDKRLGGKAKENIVVTTTVGKGTLYNIAKERGYKIYGLGKGVGGRFSVLSPVGLLPFATLGINVKKLLRGAADMSRTCWKLGVRGNPALMAAYLQYCSIKRGKNISVMMPYADSLKYMADFYCQIWGESLGKAVDNKGRLVNVGQTPVKALGVTDQHSQIQLYTEGPFDKVVTFIGVKNFRDEVQIPRVKGMDGTAFLQGHTFNELINAEREATAFALAKAKRPNFTILLDEIDEYTVGELLILMMYQTAYAGAMLNIDAYNQPGVEEGKLATFAMLGRAGYEEKLKEIKSAYHHNKFVID
jgi:glucose-6-phosphate isomerase